MANIGAGFLSVAAASNVWTDIPNSAANIVPHSNSKFFACNFCFTGYVTGGAGPVNARMLINGVQAGPAFNFYYNAVGQHQSWAWNTFLAEASAGFAVGATITVKLQILSPIGSAAVFTMDANDSWSWSVLESS